MDGPLMSARIEQTSALEKLFNSTLPMWMAP
jgi:hypothetical protein